MIFKTLVVVSVFTLVCIVRGDNKVPLNSDRSEFKRSLGKNCDDSYSFTCLKLDAVSWVDRLSSNDNINFLPGVTLVKESNGATKGDNGDLVAELAREFPDDPSARLDAYLMKKFSGFLDNHSVKLNFWKVAKAATGTARKGGGGGGGSGGGGFGGSGFGGSGFGGTGFGGGGNGGGGSGGGSGGGGGKKGGGGGGGNGYGAILAMGAMMKGAMMAMGLAAVAALAGKALMAALAALLLAAIASLKGQGGGGGGHSTYEVISKPVYTSSHSQSTSHEGGGGGWDGYGGHGRSLQNAPLPLGLQPEYQPA